MSSSSSNIMSVREMIDMAFGEPNKNVVDHKMIETILYLLARQLRILERRVEIELLPDAELNKTSLSVSEIKLQATVPKRKRVFKTVVSRGQKGTTTGSVKAGVTKKAVGNIPSASGKVLGDGKIGDIKLFDKSITAEAEMLTSDLSAPLETSTIKSSNKDKRTEEKTTYKSSSDKTSTEMSSTDQTTTMMLSTDNTKKSAKSTTTSVKDFHKLLEQIEEQREMELRVIHQRADSREVKERTPTPMASIESVEVQYEKLLVVERIPSQEKEVQAALGRLHTDAQSRAPRISVVTQEDFMKLAIAVRDLQTRFGVTAGPDFPENIQLMQELRKGASLTDAMAALQLSARLEAAEKALGRMMSLVTELANTTPGIDLNRVTNKGLGTEIVLDDAGTKSQIAHKRISMPSNKQMYDRKTRVGPIEDPSTDYHGEVSLERLPSSPTPAETAENFGNTHDFITAEELNSALKELYDDLINTVTEITNRNKINAENAIKMLKRLEGTLNASLDLGNRMNDLETLVSENADQINILDTGLTSQMTNYQEQLTQMQQNLEGGLEAMAEALASAGGDATAVAELNKNITNLQSDLETTQLRQKDLRDIQTSLSLDLQNLWKQIENLRGTKSDREEVADTLRDKAGLEALNGLVSLEQFNAVRGDLEKKIGAAYYKFNNQEIVWQKVIDDLYRELADKADLIEVITLRDNISINLEKLKCKVQGMLDIVGEPKAAAISRRLHRDSACLSCSSPAHMDLKEPAALILPALPAKRPPTLGAEDTSKPKEDGDHENHTDLPIPHSTDPRTNICHRYCGGSHTRMHNVLSRTPRGMIINPAVREFTTEIGTDGKVYMTDGTAARKPCIPCNRPKVESPLAEISTNNKSLSDHDTHLDMTPSDFRHTSIDHQPPQAQEEPSTPPMFDY